MKIIIHTKHYVTTTLNLCELYCWEYKFDECWFGIQERLTCCINLSSLFFFFCFGIVLNVNTEDRMLNLPLHSVFDAYNRHIYKEYIFGDIHVSTCIRYNQILNASHMFI